MMLIHSCQFLSLTMFALLVCGSVSGDAECIPNQRSLLLDLKHGFVLPSDLVVSWKPDSNCCNWEGITCDPISGNVIGLDLSGRNITGGIDSDALFGLTSLQSLDLSNNGFDRISIPQPGFEKLKELRRLNLSSAGFAGEIPTGISHLTTLQYLDLSISHGYYLQHENPDFQLEIPDFHTLMRNLSNLLELHLDYVNLNQDVEWSTTLLTSAPQLQVLSLRETNITGSLNKDFFQLKRLERLDLSDNEISGVLPDFPKGCALQFLYLSFKNNFAGTIPSSIGKLTQLAHLDLSYNNITGTIPSSIGKLLKLTVLDLGGNSLTGPIPGSVFALPLLQVLSLYSNQLSGELNVSLNASTSLTAIYLFGNQLCGQIPPSFFNLPSLAILDLESNNFSGAIELDMNVISRNLSYLSLSDNNLSLGKLNGTFFHAFPNLIQLRLAGCGLTKVPTFFKNLTLRDLDLSNNKIGDAIWELSEKSNYLGKWCSFESI